MIVDVDEVLGRFTCGFETFLNGRDHELRLERYALFDSVYQKGADRPVELARAVDLYHAFFHHGAEDMEPAVGAPKALARLARRANVVVLSNAPVHAREPRRRWLAKNGMGYPLVINEGRKGPVVADLAGHSRRAGAFVDDMLFQLDSAAEFAPAVHRFQHVADERLRSLAPSSPQHVRIDDWRELEAKLEQALHT